jgi:hypothetical protein
MMRGPFIYGVVIASIEKMVCASAKQKSSLALLQTGRNDEKKTISCHV